MKFSNKVYKKSFNQVINFVQTKKFIVLLTLFCSFSSAQPFLNPYAFRLAPLQPIRPMPIHSQFRLLCPPSIPLVLCLPQTSFNSMEITQNGYLLPRMYTPMIQNLTSLSNRKLRRTLLNKNWRSWEYSDTERKYKTISRRDREKKIKSSQDYSFLHTKDDDIIQEERTDGQINVKQGKLVAASTEDVVNNSAEQRIDSRIDVEQGKSVETSTEDIVNNSAEQSSDSSTRVTSSPIHHVALVESKRPDTPSCTDLSDIHTEAIDQCTECEAVKVERYERDLKNKLRSKICIGGRDQDFTNQVVQNFRNHCQPSDFPNYVKNTLVCKACQSKVPPALMLSIMYLENSGKCSPLGDDGKSKGPFQIYQSVHENRIQKICPRNLSAPQCLNDPQTSLEVSMDIVKDYYKSLNKGKRPSFRCSKKASSLEEPYDDWRKALAAYNAGSGNIRKIKSKIKDPPLGLNNSKWEKLSEWERMRVYYFQNCKKNKCLLNNLAYAEAGLGNISSGHPSVFQKWEQFAPQLGLSSLNDNSHCQ